MKLDMAESYVDAVMDDSDDAAVMAADNAVMDAEMAVDAASDADNHGDLSNRLGMLQGELAEKKKSRMAYMDDMDDMDMKAMTAEAKALKTAIAAGNMATVTVTADSIPAFDPDGSSGPITDQTAEIALEKGDAAGMLGMWNGMDYAGEAGEGDAKTTGMARIYSNAEADKVEKVAFGPNSSGLTQVSDSDAYTVAEANNSNIESPSLPETGTTTLDDDDREFAGTFMGASGTYECTSTGDCTVDPEGVVGGTWTFTPSAGAMLEKVTKDMSYLSFGWWVRKDMDGPAHAGVLYYGTSDSTALHALGASAINSDTLVGKATYEGHAAGKFAISNVLHPAGDSAGHFTAAAALMADFKGASAVSTLSGTIDAFRLNDGDADPGWSVALKEAMFSTDSFSGGMTAWSIGGSNTTDTGSWQAQMFEDKGDGNNTPDSVVGSFMSNIGATHSMVGAFGAEKQ